MPVVLSIIIAVAGFATACFFTYRAYSIAKKSAQDKISHHNKSNGKYALAK
jgi:predicted peroxiredoxin